MELCKCFPYIPKSAPKVKSSIPEVVPKSNMKWTVLPLVVVAGGIGLGYYFAVDE
jgi:hypothetical protein